MTAWLGHSYMCWVPVTRVPHTAVAPFLDQLPKCVAFCTIIKRSCGGGSRSSSPFRQEEENKK